MKRFDLSLYLVLDPDLCKAHSMIETAYEAVAGGVTMVQIRLKQASTEERIALGRSVKHALRDTSAQIIMNDDARAAAEAGLDGLHVGQQDMAMAHGADHHWREIGAHMILGVSVHDETQARLVDPASVDYIGIGPVFATPTKKDHDTPLGWNNLALVGAASPVPAVAIGGLKHEHVAGVFQAGVQGMAVVSAICGKPDPRAAALELRRAIDAVRSSY